MGSDLFVVVVGCGRLGSHLANRLSLAGHGVVVVDKDERAFGNLSPDYSGFRVEGDASELAVLKEAKVSQADMLIATTQDDNINLMVAQVAKAEFGVSRVLARIMDPRLEDIYRGLGVETICPTSIATELFLLSISSEGSK
jgi:trk system potassium uptake protein